MQTASFRIWTQVAGSISNDNNYQITKVLFPILLGWPMISETDAGGMASKVESSHQ